MKLALANAVRSQIINRLFTYLAESGEDVGMVNSNTFNFPIVYEGEESFVEIMAKVVKKDSDECYQEREDYKAKLIEKAEKKAEREKAAAEKKAQAEEKRRLAEETAAAVLKRAVEKEKAKEKGE